MSRNSSGTYSLPAGNPVVANTTISSSVQNATMADLATEMTDSLNRSGKGGMLAPFKAADGSVTAPGVTFGTDLDSGLYRVTANDIGMAIGGVVAQRWASNVIVFTIGLAITQSQSNTSGCRATGNGTGSGLQGNGGATGPGVVGNGGATSGAGGEFYGQGGNSAGAIATGFGLGSGLEGTGGNNGAGVKGIGNGTGIGGSFVANGTGSAIAGAAFGGGSSVVGNSASGTGNGAQFTGNATKSPLHLTPQTQPSNGALGDIYFSSVDQKLYVCTVAGTPGTWTPQT